MKDKRKPIRQLRCAIPPNTKGRTNLKTRYLANNTDGLDKDLSCPTQLMQLTIQLQLGLLGCSSRRPDKIQMRNSTQWSWSEHMAFILIKQFLRDLYSQKAVVGKRPAGLRRHEIDVYPENVPYRATISGDFDGTSILMFRWNGWLKPRGLRCTGTWMENWDHELRQSDTCVKSGCLWQTELLKASYLLLKRSGLSVSSYPVNVLKLVIDECLTWVDEGKGEVWKWGRTSRSRGFPNLWAETGYYYQGTHLATHLAHKSVLFSLTKLEVFAVRKASSNLESSLKEGALLREAFPSLNSYSDFPMQ
jgi:hypothetical protein